MRVSIPWSVRCLSIFFVVIRLLSKLLHEVVVKVALSKRPHKRTAHLTCAVAFVEMLAMDFVFSEQWTSLSPLKKKFSW